MSEVESQSGGERWWSGGWLRIATHGAAVLLGAVAFQVFLGDQVAEESESTLVRKRAHRVDAASQASSWVDAKLAKLRENELETEKELAEPATLEEFLEESRLENEKSWRERKEEIDQIIAKAGKMDRLADPAAAIRMSFKDGSNYPDDLVFFQHWLNSDPEAALANLGENWLLLDRELVAAMLERRFGAEWMLDRVVDEETPFRLRRKLAQELGHQLAFGEGLAGLLETYHAIPDPRLKLDLAYWFGMEWSRVEPQETAHFFGAAVPRQLREALLSEWSPQMGSSEWEGRWMEELSQALGPVLIGSDFEDFSALSIFGYAPEEIEAREVMGLDELITDLRNEGKDPADAIHGAMGTKMDQVLNDGPGLVAQVGEGQLSRAEFLDEMRRQIPGASSYPDALEREALSLLARVEDPQAIADWVGELQGRVDVGEVLVQNFAQGSIYGDQRIPLRLSRSLTISAAVEDDYSRNRMVSHTAYEWSRWQAVSPAHAQAWRDELPPDAPVLEEIREREEMERRRRETR